MAIFKAHRVSSSPERPLTRKSTVLRFDTLSKESFKITSTFDDSCDGSERIRIVGVNLACNSESKLFGGKTSSFNTDK